MRLGLPSAPPSSSPLWWFWERFTDAHTAAYKLSHGRIGGKAYGVPIVLVESVGRKSGKQRTHPLLGGEDGDNLVLIASKGGTDRHPAWYHNLQANPETTAWWKGEKRQVRARDATGEERDRALADDGRRLPGLRELPAPNRPADSRRRSRADLTR